MSSIPTEHSKSRTNNVVPFRLGKVHVGQVGHHGGRFFSKMGGWGNLDRDIDISLDGGKEFEGYGPDKTGVASSSDPATVAESTHDTGSRRMRNPRIPGKERQIYTRGPPSTFMTKRG